MYSQATASPISITGERCRCDREAEKAKSREAAGHGVHGNDIPSRGASKVGTRAGRHHRCRNGLQPSLRHLRAAICALSKSRVWAACRYHHPASIGPRTTHTLGANVWARVGTAVILCKSAGACKQRRGFAGFLGQWNSTNRRSGVRRGAEARPRGDGQLHHPNPTCPVNVQVSPVRPLPLSPTTNLHRPTTTEGAAYYLMPECLNGPKLRTVQGPLLWFDASPE